MNKILTFLLMSLFSCMTLAFCDDIAEPGNRYGIKHSYYPYEITCPEKKPYAQTGQIYHDKILTCSGTVIGKNVVLTAYACLYNIAQDSITFVSFANGFAYTPAAVELIPNTKNQLGLLFFEKDIGEFAGFATQSNPIGIKFSSSSYDSQQGNAGILGIANSQKNDGQAGLFAHLIKNHQKSYKLYDTRKTAFIRFDPSISGDRLFNTMLGGSIIYPRLSFEKEEDLELVGVITNAEKNYAYRLTPKVTNEISKVIETLYLQFDR